MNDKVKLPNELEALMQSILRWSHQHPYSRQRLLDEFVNPPVGLKKRKTYPQDWSSYNAAQTREKIIMMFILDELLDNIPFCERKSVGRKGIPRRDQIFYMVLQTYNVKSSRRCIADIELCRQLGFISKTSHFNTVLKCLNNPENIAYLKHLIMVAGLPLVDVEDSFAVDSSGFSTSQFDRWFDVRFDKDKKKEIRRFRKAHIIIGTKTNIITAANVTEGYSGDSPEFAELIRNTGNLFSIKEVSADKAYSSRNNLEIVSNAGGVAFIPFKSNASGRPQGPWIWRQMFDFFKYNRAAFDQHYHKRSNVETTFHMLKMKLDKRVRSKNPVGQENEILAKCLTHNLCVLVQEAFELGINIDFEKCAKIPIAHE